jgi:hypothetical protein
MLTPRGLKSGSEFGAANSFNDYRLAGIAPISHITSHIVPGGKTRVKIKIKNLDRISADRVDRGKLYRLREPPA